MVPLLVSILRLSQKIQELPFILKIFSQLIKI